MAAPSEMERERGDLVQESDGIVFLCHFKQLRVKKDEGLKLQFEWEIGFIIENEGDYKWNLFRPRNND